MNYLPQLVQDFLEASADSMSGRLALITENQQFTYSEIAGSANRLDHTLIDGGVRRGDRIVIYLPNSIG